jgi:hypothetical protein
MKSQWTGFHSCLGSGIEAFLAHGRALGCCFRTEEMTLRLLDRFLLAERIASLDAITPAVIDAFLASRPRTAPESYNHLLATVTRLFDWLAVRDLAPPSPVRATPRRATRARLPFLFDVAAARRLLGAAASLPEISSTPLRGPTYRTIFALLYGLGLRVGEVARLRVGDLDLARQLLVVRYAKFGKSRLVPFGPRMGRLVTGYLDLRDHQRGPLSPTTPLFSFRKAEPIQPGYPGRHRAPVCALPPAFFCGGHAAALVPQRGRPWLSAAAALDLPRSRQSCVDRGISDRHARAAGGGQSAVRALG